jgi:hypothetical protein
MHIGYALVVGASLIRFSRRLALRVAGAIYPVFMLLVVTATGNHFFFDALTGALVAVLAGVIALPITSPARHAKLSHLDTIRTPPQALEELAA